MKTLHRLLIVIFGLISAHVSAQIPAYMPWGVRAWFPFTGNAIDSTGNGHNGIMHGTAGAKGRYGVPGTALQFNGTSDYIYVPAGSFAQEKSVDITSSLTISAWVKSYNYNMSSQMQIYWRGDPAPAHDPHMLYINGGTIRIRRDVDPGTTSNEVGYPLVGIDTNYHMFTGTYDSVTSIMRIYIDGVMKNSAYLPGLQTYPTASMYNYIGAVDGGTWQFFYGFIDELAIWNRALTPCEVAALYYSSANVITAHPVNDTISDGGTASFSVSVAAPSPSYQWQVSTGSAFTNIPPGAPYSGINTATLTISPVTSALSGYQYRCMVSSDSCSNLLSNPAWLIVKSTGLAELEPKATGIQLNRNPNSGVFTVSGIGFSGSVWIEMTDILGHRVYQDEAVLNNGEFVKQVSLSATISNGIYVLSVHSKETNEHMRVVVER